MKNRLLKICSMIFYPLIACRRIIQEAPVVCCDDELLGFGDFSRYAAPEKAPVSRPAAGRGAMAPSAGKAGL